MHAYPVFTQFEGRLDDTDIEKAWKTQKWKRLKISPLSFWEKHKKAKAYRTICFAFFTWLSDAASKRAIG